jgi:Raf kinase inhibitor-like YbhB/YbcL family protein
MISDRTPLRQSRPRFAPAVVLLMTIVLVSCHGTVPAAEREGSASLALHIPGFQGDRIPESFTCSGANTSPAISWDAPPAPTKSLALILNDRDGPRGSFVHWVLFDLPPGTLSLPSAVPPHDLLPDGSRQGQNDFGEIGYGGPCPPGHARHHYMFMLFALDTKLNLPAGATRDEIDVAIKGHVLARGTLTGSFSR